MAPDEAKTLEHFYCESCSTEEQKLLQTSNVTSRHTDMKVILWIFSFHHWFNLHFFKPSPGHAPKYQNKFDIVAYSIINYWVMKITSL